MATPQAAEGEADGAICAVGARTDSESSKQMAQTEAGRCGA